MTVFHIIGYWWLALCAVGVTALATYLLADFIGSCWWRRMTRLRDVYVLNWWIAALKAHGFTVPTKSNMDELRRRMAEIDDCAAAKGAEMKYTYRHGSILEGSTQVLNLLSVNCTKKFRDRVGKTLVGILNAEERGKEIAARAAGREHD